MPTPSGCSSASSAYVARPVSRLPPVLDRAHQLAHLLSDAHDEVLDLDRAVEDPDPFPPRRAVPGRAGRVRRGDPPCPPPRWVGSPDPFLPTARWPGPQPGPARRLCRLNADIRGPLPSVVTPGSTLAETLTRTRAVATPAGWPTSPRQRLALRPAGECRSLAAALVELGRPVTRRVPAAEPYCTACKTAAKALASPAQPAAAYPVG